ncbi:MAG: RsbRD N-terminal domain-containing protein, partial [Myxococcaceae bacterium]|nr:RsbRD N-terminal domain-containing protein [Myxococcaceae bacterium]
MTLADLLERQQDAIVERWLQQVRPLAPRLGLPRVELVDTLPALLAELARALRSPDGPSAFRALPAYSHVAGEHGKQHRRLGYATDAVACEYPLLQEVILQMAQASGVEVHTHRGPRPGPLHGNGIGSGPRPPRGAAGARAPGGGACRDERGAAAARGGFP